MLRSVCKKISYLFIATGAMVLFMGFTSVRADVITGETSLCGASFVIDNFYNNADDVIIEDEDTFVSSLLSNDYSIPDNAAFAKVDSLLNIRAAASTDTDILGYLPRNGICFLESDPEYGFVKISSGDVKGYVAKEYLYTSIGAKAKAEEIAPVRATVNAPVLNIRSTPEKNSKDNLVEELFSGQSVNVVKGNKIVLDSDKNEWVAVEYDGETCYVMKKYVDVGRTFTYACSVEDVIGETDSKNVTALRASIILEAKKHIGLKYVWSGMSLTKGADCSGFCCAVFSKCGFDLEHIAGRSSSTQAASSAGRKVTYAEAKPGDLVFYRLKKGRISHVAIYLGGGKIIHESSSSGGVIISDIDCMKVAMIKNFLD